MKKIQYLDGLRGLAAFVVVFHHFMLAFYPALFAEPNAPNHLSDGIENFASGSVFNLFYNGKFAVSIFFVLSGYVLTYKFFNIKDYSIIAASATKRYMRLALPAAFSVMLAFVLMKISFFYNQQAALLSGSEWIGFFWNFTPNFFDALRQSFIGAFFSEDYDYNALLWTISYEFIGSFLVFAFTALFGKNKNRLIFYLLAILIFFQTYYLAFILGMLLSDLSAHKKLNLTQIDTKKLLRFSLLIIGLFFGSIPSGRDLSGTIYSFFDITYLSDAAAFFHTIGAFMTMLVLLDSKRLQKFFSHKYLLFLGEISFSLYLLHFIVIGTFSSFIFVKLYPLLPYHTAFLTMFGLSLPVIFLVSYGATKYIDKHSMNASHLVYEKIFKPEETN
jgi:peptidoglycan/LPS O-acetylase OafA/YrhL